MQKRLKALCAIFIVGLLSISSICSAEDCRDDCYGTFTFHADLLLWQPCADGIFVGTKTNEQSEEGVFDRG